MKKLLLSTATLSTLALAGCSSGTVSDTLEEKLKNPLFAEQFYDELVDHMVTLEIQNDPLIEDASMKRAVEEQRVSGLAKAKESNAQQLQGRNGRFISDRGYSVGEALLLDKMVYFNPTFVVQPSPELHVYLSTVLDPRDEGVFPDEGLIDLGLIKSPYGDQSYEVDVSDDVDLSTMRTIVLWDNTFNRLYGFVQLQSSL